MRHVLNNTATPSLQTFTDIAIPIGVIESNIADPQPWIMSNFIGLHFRFSWTQIVFDVPPFYKWDCFESKCIRIDRHNQQQFTRLIREQLIDNHYIYMFANEFYIPIRNTYHKRKTNHDLCIYGFDDEKQIFFVSAYDTHHYSLQTIAYEDLYLSFLYYAKWKKIRWKNHIVAFKIKKNFPFRSYDCSKIQRDLYHYCTSKIWGYEINIYSFLQYHVNQLIKDKSAIDMHYFRILMEHMQVINGLHLSSVDYSRNVSKARKIFLMALKFTLTREKDLLFKIKSELEQLKNNEIKALEPYIRSNFSGSQLQSFCSVYSKHFPSQS